jgi:hypothetical protein
MLWAWPPLGSWGRGRVKWTTPAVDECKAEEYGRPRARNGGILSIQLRDELRKLLEPVVLAAEDPEGWSLVLGLVGHAGEVAEHPELRAALDRLGTAARAVGDLDDDSLRSWEGLDRLVRASGDAMAALRELESGVGHPDLAALLANLGQELAEQLVALYLRRHHARLFRAASLLTLVDPSEQTGPIPPVLDGATLRREAWMRDALRFDRAGALVQRPWATLAEVYFPNALAGASDAHLAAQRLFPLLGALAGVLGTSWSVDQMPVVPAPPPAPPPDEEAQLGDHLSGGPKPPPEEWSAARPLTPAEREALDRETYPRLRITVPQLDEAGAVAGARLGIAVLASSAQHPGGVAGLMVGLGGTLDWTETRGSWRLAAASEGQVPAFVIGPDGLEPAPLDTAALGGAARLTIDRLAESPDGPAFVFGSETGTRLELGALRAEALLAMSPTARSAALTVAASKGVLVIAAGDGDGFLQRVLPPDGLRTEFDFGIGLSSAKGLHFQGAAGLDATLPVRADLLGIVAVDAVHLGLRAADDRLAAELSATATVTLGPVTVGVERMGLEALLAFPPDGGNLGAADLAVRFKPPSGAALSVDAGFVTGGGYLFYDAGAAQYAGVLQLQLAGKLGVNAVGILSTRMPDRSPGFSLLVIFTAQGFAPIQLGFGFTLTGIGGLLGVNRTVDAEAMRAGIKSGAADSILFPADPVRNAPAIVSNLSTLLPAAPDRLLIGPLGIIEWGTPTLLKAKLAVLLELPQPVRLSVLGRLSALIPHEKHPLIKLQLDAFGRIDFEKGDLALDASLFDSRVLDWVLTGDMALRANWGSNPTFVLAVGGFNPRFPVPAGFPKLQRVTVSLADGGALKLRLAAYFALTSNTLQFGARLDLAASAAGFTLEGMLSIDTLIQFSPFEFVADLAASLALRHGRTVITSIGLRGTLSGPSPWHVQGKARFSILFFSFEIAFDETFGPAIQPPPPEPVDVGAILRAELGAVQNWSSELPPGAQPLVSLLEVPGGGVLAHPLGVLTLRQRRVPLDRRISRFGSSVPAEGPTAYHVDVTTASGAKLPPLQAVEDLYARSQFEPMTDAEKLSAPSFEKMGSGFRLGSEAIEYQAALVLDLPVQYETLTFDPLAPVPAAEAEAPPPYRLPPQVLADVVGANGAGSRRRAREVVA